MYASLSILSWLRGTRRVYKLRKSEDRRVCVWRPKQQHVEDTKEIKVCKIIITCLWSYVPVIGSRDFRCIFDLINIQIGLLTVVSTLQSLNGACAPVFEQRIRNCNLKYVRHREPGGNTCICFKLKSVIDFLIHYLICSGRAVESHIELRNVLFSSLPRVYIL